MFINEEGTHLQGLGNPMPITDANTCFCYSNARSLAADGCGIGSVSQGCCQTPELLLFSVFHALVQWPHGCRMQGGRPQVSGRKRGRGKRHREAHGLRDTAKSVPFYQESRTLPETTTGRCLLLAHWPELGPVPTLRWQGSRGAGLWHLV